MAIGIQKKKKQLDEKECFDLWIETGSVYKAIQVLFRDGKFNTQTGKSFTHQAVWEASWRYCLKNPVEARVQVEKVWKANGELLTDGEWYSLLANKAKYVFRSKKSYTAYMDSHSYLKPYQGI